MGFKYLRVPAQDAVEESPALIDLGKRLSSIVKTSHVLDRYPRSGLGVTHNPHSPTEDLASLLKDFGQNPIPVAQAGGQRQAATRSILAT